MARLRVQSKGKVPPRNHSSQIDSNKCLLVQLIIECNLIMKIYEQSYGPLGEITYSKIKYTYSDINITFSKKGHEEQQTRELDGIFMYKSTCLAS